MKIKMQDEINQDEVIISKIINTMMNNPDKNGAYPITQCLNILECYVKNERNSAITWTWFHACNISNSKKDGGI